jgi:hypothetical protein
VGCNVDQRTPDVADGDPSGDTTIGNPAAYAPAMGGGPSRGGDDGNAEAAAGTDSAGGPASPGNELVATVPRSCMSGEASTCDAVHGSKGGCGTRVLVCSNDGAWPDQSSCAAREADVELCDAAGADEDCDGRSNEDCPCSAGEVRTCNDVYASVGDCAARTLTCLANGSWPPQEGCAPAGPELCNQDGRDENCDGRINERPPCEAFVSLSVSSYGACGISTDGGAYCWGENEAGIVGDGTRVDRFVPTRVLSNAQSIVTGVRTCAVLDSGAVNCWGDGQGGLGDGTRNSSAVPIATQPLGASAIDIQGQGHFNCVLLDPGGSVSCWGFVGPLEWMSVPTLLPGFADVVNLAASDGHVCGVLSNGTIECLGNNSNGELGDGTFGNSSSVPVQVRGIDTARQVSANQFWTCAVLVDGRAQCWGQNRDLGDGVTTDSSTPVTVQGLNDAIQISAGRYHACAVRSDGTIHCWGTFGALDSPIYGSLSGVQSVHCGNGHTCALLSDGSAYCWGGALAALGGGPDARGNVPVRVWGP